MSNHNEHIPRIDPGALAYKRSQQGKKLSHLDRMYATKYRVLNGLGALVLDNTPRDPRNSLRALLNKANNG